MESGTWLGVGLFIWLLGLLQRVFGIGLGDETIQVPRWLAFVLLSRGDALPVPSLFFQLWGVFTAIYGLTFDRFMSDKMIGLIVGLLLPMVMARMVIIGLRR